MDGLASSARWRKLHGKRRAAVRRLRRAGYVARKRYARRLEGMVQRGRHQVEDWRYSDGPLQGLPAVDPWAVAFKLAMCSSSWYVQLRADGGNLVDPVAVPRPCGLDHLCPVCASRFSSALAAALRLVLQEDLPGRPLALVTLTQRAKVGESLESALARWRRAWELMTRGAPGREFAELVAGWYYGLEVTRGDVGKWWHLHAHLVVVLHPGVEVAKARAWVGSTWRRSTESAGPGLGWQPEAGGCVLGPAPARFELPDLDALHVAQLRELARALPLPLVGAWQLRRAELVEGIRRLALEWDTVRADHRRVESWAGGWWRDIDPEDPAQVYQACKYPSPLADLAGDNLVEFLAVNHGRRWHQGGGVLRSVVARAKLLEQDLEPDQGEDAGTVTDRDLSLELGEAPPAQVALGQNVASCAPHESPDLDAVAPGLGWEGKPLDGGKPISREHPWACWRVPGDAFKHPNPDVVQAVENVGGQVKLWPNGEWWAWVPLLWVREGLARRHQATATRRRARERILARRSEAIAQLREQRPRD